MDSEQRDFSASHPPPPLEEEYWEALLREGEYAESPYENLTQLPSSQPNVPPEYMSQHDRSTNHHVDASAIEQDWQDIEAIMQADETVTLDVTGYNRGGLLVEWRHIRGFVPASQLVNFPAHLDATARSQRLMEQVERQLTLRVIELDREQNRLVLSERAAQVEAGARDEILDNLQHGDIVTGSITNICDFGAFVDLGGLEGLIHISELSWGRVGHPADVLKRDQEVRVYVLETDKDAGRVALSIKRLRSDPWRTVEERYEVGETIEGTITNVVEFGAFARIEEGLEGLIHVSELAEGHFLHPRNVVQENQTVHARILSIDSESRRLGLSLRGVPQPED